MKNVYIYLFDGFSDWEIAYITPEINNNAECQIVCFSNNGQSVKSMGGLSVNADMAITAVDTDQVDMLVLPGGMMWQSCNDEKIVDLITRLNHLKKPIAAICAATSRLARLGILDNVKHTSNALEYLEWAVPTYRGRPNYVAQPAVTGNNIITARGTSPIEFAREVLTMLHIKTEAEIEKWYQLYKNSIWSE